MRLRTRVFLAIFVLTAAGGAFFLRWILDDLRTRYLEAVEENLVDTANLLASLLESTATSEVVVSDGISRGLEAVKNRRFEARIYQLVKTGVDLRVYVADSAGIVVFDSRAGGGDLGKDYSEWLDVSRTLAGAYGARTTRRDPEDESSSTLFVSAPIRFGGRVAGVVTVAKPTRSVNLFLEMARPKIAFAAILAGLAMTLAAWLLSLWLSRPLQRLALYARQVRDGASPPLPDLGASEVRELGKAFEEMKIALEGRAYVETYVQSLTHELKSPLTAIQAASEILSEDPPESVRARFVENIRGETSRMRDTVDHLLELAALETRTGLRNPEAIDLASLLASQCRALEPLAGRRGISFSIVGAATVLGERFLLERAFRNLLANALDFSPDGSSIDATLRTESGRAWVEIRDRGPGIPDFAKDKVFERFYSLARPDGSRRGSGLGLPFVREALRLHGGSVELLAASDGGTVARVVF